VSPCRPLHHLWHLRTVTFGYLSGALQLDLRDCAKLPIGVLLDKFGIRRVGPPLALSCGAFASFWGGHFTPNYRWDFLRLVFPASARVGEAPTFSCEPQKAIRVLVSITGAAVFCYVNLRRGRLPNSLRQSVFRSLGFLPAKKWGWRWELLPSLASISFCVFFLLFFFGANLSRSSG